MPTFVDAEHFLNLRLCLEEKILGRTAAENKTRRASRLLFSARFATTAAATLRRQHYRRRFVYIQRWIKREFASLQRFRGDVHADGRIAGRRSVNRHAILVSHREQRFIFQAERAFTLMHIPPGLDVAGA